MFHMGRNYFLKSLSRSTVSRKEALNKLPTKERVIARQYHKRSLFPYNGNLISLYNGSFFNFSTATQLIQSPKIAKSNFTAVPKRVPLDTGILKKIEEDLILSDLNKDGRIDASELKIILKKYSDTFSDEDILKISELFYVSKGGESVSHQRFIKAISAAMNADLDKMKVGEESHQNINYHPLELGSCGAEFMYGKNRQAYTPEELDVKLTHVEPKNMTDRMAYACVRVVRFCFDTVSGWNFGDITQAKIFRRVIFLESVAAIPGFVAAMVRHFKSLRQFHRDGGMLNMFLDEANNERMHLLTFVRMRDPPKVMRYLVLASQTVIGAAFFTLYHISPGFCHRFVGYVEEEACHTYTDIIKAIKNAPEGSELAAWRTDIAPTIARGYWHLGADATVLDLFYAIRADEAEHRDVNHTCSGLKEDEISPFYNPDEKFNKVLKQYVQEMMKKGDDKIVT